MSGHVTSKDRKWSVDEKQSQAIHAQDFPLVIHFLQRGFTDSSFHNLPKTLPPAGDQMFYVCVPLWRTFHIQTTCSH